MTGVQTCALPISGVPGDMDGDCDVQLNDVLLFAENWLVCVNPLDERCQAD